MKVLRDFFSVIDMHTVLVTVLAVASTYICGRLGLEAEIPTALIGLAVVFPIVFSIQAAYRRREECLAYFGGLKAHAVALYYAHRDWVPEGKGVAEAHHDRSRLLVQELIDAITLHFTEGEGRSKQSFRRVYDVMSRFSVSHEAMREAGVPPNEISRISQYLSKILIDFEKMNNILMYRTPLSLRAYSYVFLNAFPIVFAPYFAYLSSEYYPAVGYLVAVVYSLVLVTLDNIQEDLEDPFDQIGTDDVKLDVADDYREVCTPQPPLDVPGGVTKTAPKRKPAPAPAEEA